MTEATPVRIEVTSIHICCEALWIVLIPITLIVAGLLFGDIVPLARSLSPHRFIGIRRLGLGRRRTPLSLETEAVVIMISEAERCEFLRGGSSSRSAGN